MDSKCVRDLMVPLDEYAVVDQGASLLDAVLALEKAQKHLPPGRQPYRAVLVLDKKKKIVGKIGQLSFLKALEPKYNVLGDLGALSRAGVSQEFVSSMMEHFRFFQDSLNDLGAMARSIRVDDVMHPLTDSIEENASLREAIHKIVMGQTLSILVTRSGEVVGLLRLSELVDEVFTQMKAPTA